MKKVGTAEDSRKEEIELVRRAAAGAKDAFKELYEIYVDRLYRFILFRTNDPQLAEDLLSSVFLKAWENLGRFKTQQAPFGAWLFRIARNAIIDHYRVQKQHGPLSEAEHSIADPSEDVQAQVEQRAEIETILAAMARLTEEQREVLVLKLIEGLTTREIALAMNKSEGAVRALQMRGLQSLSEILGS